MASMRSRFYFIFLLWHLGPVLFDFLWRSVECVSARLQKCVQNAGACIEA
jgi:hypothetical protein